MRHSALALRFAKRRGKRGDGAAKCCHAPSLCAEKRSNAVTGCRQVLPRPRAALKSAAMKRPHMRCQVLQRCNPPCHLRCHHKVCSHMQSMAFYLHCIRFCTSCTCTGSLTPTRMNPWHAITRLTSHTTGMAHVHTTGEHKATRKACRLIILVWEQCPNRASGMGEGGRPGASPAWKGTACAAAGRVWPRGGHARTAAAGPAAVSRRLLGTGGRAAHRSARPAGACSAAAGGGAFRGRGAMHACASEARVRQPPPARWSHCTQAQHHGPEASGLSPPPAAPIRGFQRASCIFNESPMCACTCVRCASLGAIAGVICRLPSVTHSNT